MSKTAFVTGGTGFLGIQIIHELLKEGWQVTALHRPASNLKRLRNLEVELVEGSIVEKDSLVKAVPEKVDAVFHVAGNTSLWRKKNEEQYNDNVLGTKNMVEVALQKEAKKFLHTSSIAAFSIHNSKIDEQTESNALHCSINYHKTKYQGELEVLKGIEKGLNATILNPNHIMGAYDAHNWAQLIILRAKNKLLGIPPGIGMFGHGVQIAKAHVRAAEVGKNGHRYLLGGVESNFLQVINTIEEILNFSKSKKEMPKIALKAMVQFGKMQSVFSNKEPEITPEKYALLTEYAVCNDSKAKRELGYQHDSLEEMIKATVDWLR